MRVPGTTAVVTGGASGLGAATAAHLAKRGADVFVLDLPAALARTAPPAGITGIGADVTSAGEVGAAMTTVAESGSPLRIVVNCAGVDTPGRVLTDDGPLGLAEFRRVVEVNLVGTFNVLRLGAEVMARTRPEADDQRGVIVNTASLFAFEGQAGHAAYAAAKGGVVSLTLPAARDLARYGIRVVTVAPGIFETPLVATLTEELRAAGLAEQFVSGLAGGPPWPRRYGRPEEFAAFVAAIAEHDYLNAEVVRLDAGLRVGFGKPSPS
ncbi:MULTISPECIES: SDR family NAD(P)-dependent oxidoreductase [Amycolatopsis]|uniref:3-hydroxy-2-methylbutyryl-CoA dehydrogenase n=1 Tax=Amycolatopsis bullii TaxID=941987 RepID=A0ABQ3KSD0_9PSEU|nr:SDR family NAD(P)-dependent oxidoreductase [Amycolatopsis bullii]GHG48331.1 3-hydroxy-2-methylbutyryl-CoA dehydrogenase [Amycolatopsis bullii]